VPLWCFASAHFTVAGLCYAKPLYATAKRQLPVTLYAICPEFVVEKKQKIVYNNKTKKEV